MALTEADKNRLSREEMERLSAASKATDTVRNGRPQSSAGNTGASLGAGGRGAAGGASDIAGASRNAVDTVRNGLPQSYAAGAGSTLGVNRPSGNKTGTTGGGLPTGYTPGSYQAPDEIQKLQNAQKQAALAQLQAAVNSQVSGYKEQIAALEPQYQSLRSQSEVERYKSNAALRESLANSGEIRGGQGRQDMLNLQNAYASRLGQLNTQQQAQTDSYNRAIADAVSQGRLSAAQMAAQYDAQAAQMTLSDRRTWEQMQQQSLNDYRNFLLNEAGVTGMYNGQQTLAAREAERNFLLNEAGVTGMYGGNPTLEYQKYQSDNDYRNQQLQLDEAYRRDALAQDNNHFLVEQSGRLPDGSYTLAGQKQETDTQMGWAEILGIGPNGEPTLDMKQLEEMIRSNKADEDIRRKRY